MLEQIRRNRKLILWILLALIVPPFIFFGIESAFVKKKDPIVGILFGKKILLSDFYKAKTLTLAMLNVRQPNRSIDLSFLNQLTWQRLVLIEQAKHLKLKISDSELSKAIIQNFYQDHFDSKSYEFFVKQVLKLSVFEFENAYRDTMLIEKFQEVVSKLIQITDDEIYEAYLYEKEKLEISYCEIPFDRFLNSIQVSESEMKDYFSQNKESFRVGIQRKVSYFIIPFKDFEKEVLTSQEKVENYYREHRDDFKDPLNKIYSDVENKMKSEKARVLADKQSKKIYRAISKERSLKKISQKFNLTPHHSNLFSEEQPNSLWNNNPAIIKKIFESELKEPLDPFFYDQAFYIVIPTSEKPSYIPNFEEVKSKIHDLLLEKKAREKAKTEAARLKTAVSKAMEEEKLSFADACQKNNEQAVNPPSFSRQESELPNDSIREMKQSAWNQAFSKVSDIYSTHKGCGFFIILNASQPSRETFEKDKDLFHEMALNRKRQKFFYEYYDWLLKQCKFSEQSLGTL
jgi:peptidyl-prolyl cis-trans isomerase D